MNEEENIKPMIEAVQRNMGTTDLEALRPVMLATDAGPVRARRVLALLIAQEQRGVTVSAPSSSRGTSASVDAPTTS